MQLGDKKSAGYPPEVLKEMLRINYSEEAQGYDKERYEDRPHDVRLAEMIRSLLPKYIKGKSVLELACGTGHWGEYLTSLGYEYKGIEINGKMVEECQCKGLDVEQADVEDIRAYSSAKADTIICIKAFGFFPEPVHVLRIARSLGGRFINFYYNDRYHNLIVRLYSLFRDPDEIAYQPPWDNRFTWKEYKWMCEEAGLEVVYMRDLVVLPFKAIPKQLRPLVGKLDDRLTHNGFVTMVVCDEG